MDRQELEKELDEVVFRLGTLYIQAHPFGQEVAADSPVWDEIQEALDRLKSLTEQEQEVVYGRRG